MPPPWTSTRVPATPSSSPAVRGVEAGVRRWVELCAGMASAVLRCVPGRWDQGRGQAWARLPTRSARRVHTCPRPAHVHSTSGTRHTHRSGSLATHSPSTSSTPPRAPAGPSPDTLHITRVGKRHVVGVTSTTNTSHLARQHAPLSRTRVRRAACQPAVPTRALRASSARSASPARHHVITALGTA